MTLRSYLWGVRLSTLVVFAAWVVVLMSVDPESSGVIGQVLFYVTFFLFFAGLSILLFTFIWRRMTEDMLTVTEINMSFRQGILLSLLITILIFFQQLGILIWWSALLVAAGILLIELYFLTRSQ